MRFRKSGGNQSLKNFDGQILLGSIVMKVSVDNLKTALRFSVLA